MKIAQINNYLFKYNEKQTTCFADFNNERIAFIHNSETQLVIDIIDGKLTFHPEKFINIFEETENHYLIEMLD